MRLSAHFGLSTIGLCIVLVADVWKTSLKDFDKQVLCNRSHILRLKYGIMCIKMAEQII